MPPESTIEAAIPAEGREAPPLAIPLRAGPLRLVLDRGELRWIRLGEREVLRGIYAAVREPGWATVPARIEELELEAEPESFRVSFVARHARGELRIDWRARIEGQADGRIRYSIDGIAGSTFRRNRIGFCVLHPASVCAGAACTLETVDGRRQATSFPRLVSPDQPFLEVRAISHEPVAGVVAEVRLEGDTFETEDQRNWSDASFKTYAPPLALPFPVEVASGTRISQSVTLRLLGATRELVRETTAAVPGALRKRHNGLEPVVVRQEDGELAPVPALGLAGGERLLEGEADVALLRQLGLDHLRADLHLHDPAGWREALARAVANAEALGLPLELALLLPEDPEPALRQLAAEELPARLSRWLVFRASDQVTHDGDVQVARELLSARVPGARFSGGSFRYFAELNRRRPSAAALDRVTFSLNPQVHAFDDATLFENLATLPWLAETARSFAGGRPLAISPATLRPRADPRPTSSQATGEPAFSDDPRQSTPVAAAWALGLVASAARAGFAAITLFEPAGPRGLLGGSEPYPVFHALADVTELAGASVAPVYSRRPERVQAVALRRGRLTRLFLANLTPDSHPVRLERLGTEARSTPLGAATPPEACGTEIELGPRAVLRLDLEGTE